MLGGGSLGTESMKREDVHIPGGQEVELIIVYFALILVNFILSPGSAEEENYPPLV